MTCYKCGKELPPGDTSGECEDGCGEDIVTDRVFTIEIALDRPKLERQPEQFNQAANEFSKLMGEALVASGLFKFCILKK